MTNKSYHLTTGKEDFNSLFYHKGIYVDPVEGTSILIEGGAGVGKTTLAIELVLNALKHTYAKATVLYYLFDQTVREIKLMIENLKGPEEIQIKGVNWPGEFERDTDYTGIFNIIEAKGIETGVEKQTSLIRKHVDTIDQDIQKIVVIDSVGANSGLARLERGKVSHFLDELKELKSILILIREHDKKSEAPQIEYLTNLVIDLQVQESLIGQNTTERVFKTTMEIKKSRNQPSLRGPHEFEIISSDQRKNESSGFVVYPSLPAIAALYNLSPELNDFGSPFALFHIEPLDKELALPLINDQGQITAEKSGIPYGHSLLLKGPPGNKKTELAVKFLLEDNLDEKVLFVSCRIDEVALRQLDIFKGPQSKEYYNTLKNKLVFIDARDPYKTPAQIIAKIRAAVESEGKVQIRKAVIFGIGMLETLPLFRGHVLHFLQVLLAYFKNKRVCSIWVDWKLSTEYTPGLQSDFAINLVAAALSVEQFQVSENESKVLLKVIRKNFRSYQKKIGFLEFDQDKTLTVKKSG